MQRKHVTENGNHNAQSEELDDVELFLYPHPDFSNELLELLKTPSRYIKTTTSATVTHIFHYLLLRFQLDGSSNTLEKRKNLGFSMFTKKERNFIKLTDTLTLFQIRDMYWKENKPIELYFLLVEYRGIKQLNSKSSIMSKEAVDKISIKLKGATQKEKKHIIRAIRKEGRYIIKNGPLVVIEDILKYRGIKEINSKSNVMSKEAVDTVSIKLKKGTGKEKEDIHGIRKEGRPIIEDGPLVVIQDIVYYRGIKQLNSKSNMSKKQIKKTLAVSRNMTVQKEHEFHRRVTSKRKISEMRTIAEGRGAKVKIQHFPVLPMLLKGLIFQI